MTSPTPPSAGERLAAAANELANCIEAAPAFKPETNAVVVQALRQGAVDSIEAAKLRERVNELEAAMREISELDDSRCTTWFDVAHQQIKIALRALAGEKP